MTIILTILVVDIAKKVIQNSCRQVRHPFTNIRFDQEFFEEVESVIHFKPHRAGRGCVLEYNIQEMQGVPVRVGIGTVQDIQQNLEQLSQWCGFPLRSNVLRQNGRQCKGLLTPWDWCRVVRIVCG